MPRGRGARWIRARPVVIGATMTVHLIRNVAEYSIRESGPCGEMALEAPMWVSAA
jgi:hypothetical protein